MENLFDLLEKDIYNPPTKPSLQQWDNYGIYSIVCIDKVDVETNINYYKVLPNDIPLLFVPSTLTASLVPAPQPNTVTNTIVSEAINLLAIQSYAPSEIKINFLDYVNQYHGT